MTVESGTVGGLVAGRYAIECELARGGMGVVFRVVDRSTGSPLALKRSIADDASALARNASLLEREYRTLVTLRHPRIIQVYDYGLDEQGSFYTMELLDGSDLRARSPLDWRELCGNLRDVASSLALLHSRRLLHRDVSAGNIRLTGEGRAKLIDFGTLMSFGRSDLIAGTPSGVAPEALEGGDLDHRLDLYALGATAYYGLTKRHAYAARSLRDLPNVWGRGPPAPPSEHVAGIPKELDELVLSLLRLDRSLRPASAAEVIDRLAAIAGLLPEKDDRVAQSYLVGHELIGREKELVRLGSRLDRALAGRGSALLVGCAPGHGRSTLLARFESGARVAGATVLAVNARAHQRPFGIWHALVQRARRELPGQAAAAEMHLGPDATGQHGAGTPGFVSFFLELAKTTPLLLLVDDIHAADNHSLPVFLSLARTAAKHRLLLVATLDTDDPGADRPALKLIRRGAGRVRLHPFDAEQSERLVRSIFGDVPSTKRLAAWLHQQTGGNPSLCAELVSHLVKEGRIHYAEGTWVLPHEFPEEDVHAVMATAVEGRLARLRPELRRVAECLSPHRRSLDAALSDVLREADPKLANLDLDRSLAELVREGVLIGDEGGFAFVNSRVRELLYASLDENRRRHLHHHAARTLGARAAGNPEREFEAGRHLLLAGDRAGAYVRISLNMLDVASRPDSLVRAVPELQDLHREYERIGGTIDERLQVMGSLVVSGYYVDPTVHDEFGDSTAELLQERAGFALAARLAWMGSYPALFAGLLWGIVRYTWSARTLRAHLFSGIVHSFVGVCAARSAVAYLRLEPHTHELLLRLLAPAKGLHKNNGLRLVYDLIAIASAANRGAWDEVHDGHQDQLARLPHVRLFTEESRHHYEAGLLCGLGRCHLFRVGDAALECANRVDAMGGQHDRILAQSLRCSYHRYRGETTKADEADEVLDTMTAQYGYRWVPDILAVLDLIPYHLSADVVGLKRVLHRTEQVLALAPTFVTYRDVILAMYEGHRGRPEVALGLYEKLEDRLRPFSHPVWPFAHAHRAECLNALGRHDEALAICEEGSRHVGALSRIFVVAYQQLEREGAIALAGLGRVPEAARRIDDLLAFHKDDSHPLVIGLLHRDRARIARVALDHAAFERHSAKARAQFSVTGNPTLLAQARRLAELSPEPPESDSQSETTAPDEHFGLLQSVAGAPLHVMAQRALEHIVTLTGASRAYLYLMQDGRPVLSATQGGNGAAPPLEAKVEELLAAFSEHETAKTASAEGRTPDEDSSAVTLFPLVAARDGRNHAVGAAAVFECERPNRVTGHYLREMAVALRAGAVTIVDAKPRGREPLTQDR